MSKYTTQLRFPVEMRLQEKGKKADDEESWGDVYPMLGLADYPIYDESHRKILNNKIIRTYWFRELGFETVAQFAWYMRSRMHNIMPYYNQLYESAELDLKPLVGFDRTRTDKRERSDEYSRTQKADGTSTSSSDGKNIFNDTPMNGLDTGAIETGAYATGVTFDHENGESKYGSTGESKGSGNGRDSRDVRETGFDEPLSELVLKYRKAIVNIDMEIVESLSDMFMTLW